MLSPDQTTEIPTLAAKPKGPGLWSVRCPYCGGRAHYHGALGVQRAHCGGGDYVILPAELPPAATGTKG